MEANSGNNSGYISKSPNQPLIYKNRYNSVTLFISVFALFCKKFSISARLLKFSTTAGSSGRCTKNP